MKELSIEEKARRYDEALTKARNIVKSINVGLIGKDSFEVVFPELKESKSAEEYNITGIGSKNAQGKLGEMIKKLKPVNEVLEQNHSITDEELAQAKKEAYNDALDNIEYHSGEPTFDDGWSAAIDYIRKKSLRLKMSNYGSN